MREGTLPGFGYYTDTFVKAPFGQFSGPGHLNRDVEMSQKALDLAVEMGIEEFIQEARVNQGYIMSLKALYELSRLVKGGRIEESKKAEAARWFQTYVDSLRQANDAMPKWESTIMRPGEQPVRSAESVRVCGELIRNMADVAAEMGIKLR